jgi:hypothetical protein
MIQNVYKKEIMVFLVNIMKVFLYYKQTTSLIVNNREGDFKLSMLA